MSLDKRRLALAVYVLAAVAWFASAAHAQTNPRFIDNCAIFANASIMCPGGTGTQPSLNGAFVLKQDFPAITRSCGDNSTNVATTAYVANCGTGGGGGSPGGVSGNVQANNGSGGFSGLTNAQLTALINTFTSSLPGAVPASGGGTTTFLRADGTFSTVPSGSGGTVTGVGITVPQGLAITGCPITTSGTCVITWSGTIPSGQIANFTSALNGGVPASGGGLLNFLRADGSWTTLTGLTVGGISLAKNTAGQNFTFELINATNNAPLTGATVVGFTSRDGGAQASTAGAFTEIGRGVYNYAPTQAETNCNECGFLFTATNAVPTNVMLLTGGFQKNVAGQHITFAMYSTSGVADASATVSVAVTKDGVGPAAGTGTITNLTRGQYDYAPATAETNCNNCSYGFTATGDVPQNISAFSSVGSVVSSVNVTVPQGFAITGCPIVSTGTCAISLSGTFPNTSIPNFSSTLNGGVPASGGGTTNFLRADQTWAAPPGGGGGGTPTFQTYQTFTSGSSVSFTATSTNVLHIKVRMIGGGGGGGAQVANAGSAGAVTSFGGWTAINGSGGNPGNSNTGGGGGSGGVAGSGNLIARISGGTGTSGIGSPGAGTLASGAGCSSPFGGAGQGTTNAAGGSAQANTGSGGGGGGGQGSTGSGSGGGCGEYVEFIMTKAQFASATYTVGSGGGGGAAGNTAGGAGAAGIILVEEYYY